MQYHVLFGVDGRSIQFQGKEGIVNPMNILSNGRIVKNYKPTEEVISKTGIVFDYVHDGDILFIPDGNNQL